MENPIKVDDLGVPLFLDIPTLHGWIMKGSMYFEFEKEGSLEPAV